MNTRFGTDMTFIYTPGPPPTDYSFSLTTGLKVGLAGTWIYEPFSPPPPPPPTDYTFDLDTGLKLGTRGSWPATGIIPTVDPCDAPLAPLDTDLTFVIPDSTPDAWIRFEYPGPTYPSHNLIVSTSASSIRLVYKINDCEDAEDGVEGPGPHCIAMGNPLGGPLPTVWYVNISNPYAGDATTTVKVTQDDCPSPPPPPPPPYTIEAHFTAANGTLAEAYTAEIGGIPNVNVTGKITIQSNQLLETVSDGANINVMWDGTDPEGTLAVSVTVPASGNYAGGIVLRGNSSGSARLRYIFTNSGVFTSGLYADNSPVSFFSPTWTAGQTYLIEFVLTGNNIEFKRDGVSLTTFTTSTYNTQTYFGLNLLLDGTFTASLAFDDLTFLP